MRFSRVLVSAALLSVAAISSAYGPLIGKVVGFTGKPELANFRVLVKGAIGKQRLTLYSIAPANKQGWLKVMEMRQMRYKGIPASYLKPGDKVKIRVIEIEKKGSPRLVYSDLVETMD